MSNEANENTRFFYVISRSWSENGPRMIRARLGEVAKTNTV